MKLLKNDLSESALKNLRQKTVVDLESLSPKSRFLINSLYRSGDIDDFSLEDALVCSIFNQARFDYAILTDKDQSPLYKADDVTRPDCLAYGLMNTFFTDEEIREFPFKEFDNPIRFIHRFKNDELIEDLKYKTLGLPHEQDVVVTKQSSHSKQ